MPLNCVWCGGDHEDSKCLSDPAHLSYEYATQYRLRMDQQKNTEAGCYHQFGLCQGRKFQERWESLECKP